MFPPVRARDIGNRPDPDPDRVPWSGADRLHHLGCRRARRRHRRHSPAAPSHESW